MAAGRHDLRTSASRHHLGPSGCWQVRRLRLAVACVPAVVV